LRLLRPLAFGLASWRQEPSFEQQISARFAEPDRGLADRLQENT
jgi:hypothetical protein